MMGSKPVRIVCATLLGALVLGSCSSAYDIRAVSIDGHLAFEPLETDVWGNPDCVKWIEVTAIDGPLEGDGRIVWTRGRSNGPCELDFPIAYGGHADDDPSATSYGPKPLVRGLTYEVVALSPGSAYGGGRFRMTEEGEVENLPLTYDQP